MKLSEWKRLFAKLEEHFPDDPEVLVSDYSQRGYPTLDLDYPVDTIDPARHVTADGIVMLPFDLVRK